jgi:hypothetical protein
MTYVKGHFALKIWGHSAAKLTRQNWLIIYPKPLRIMFICSVIEQRTYR